MRYLLDTNVVSEMGRPKPHRNVLGWLRSVSDSELAIGAITVRELTTGVERLKARQRATAVDLAQAIGAMLVAYEDRILPIDKSVAIAWGELLARKGSKIDDAALAAIARVHGLIVVTRNVRDFAGRGVRVLDPFRAPNR